MFDLFIIAMFIGMGFTFGAVGLLCTFVLLGDICEGVMEIIADRKKKEQSEEK